MRGDIDENFEGDASLRVSLKHRGKTGDGGVLQVVPVQERAKYRLSGYIRQQRQALSLLVSGRDCPPFTKKVSSQGAKDSWSKVGLDFETPRGCRTVQVQIVAEGVPPAEEEMTGWFDALEMVRTRL